MYLKVYGHIIGYCWTVARNYCAHTIYTKFLYDVCQ